jgi:hypothetical protein
MRNQPPARVDYRDIVRNAEFGGLFLPGSDQGASVCERERRNLARHWSFLIIYGGWRDAT